MVKVGFLVGKLSKGISECWLSQSRSKLLWATCSRNDSYSLLLLLLGLLDVELELLALEDVAIETANLAGAGGHTGEQLSAGELVGNLGVDNTVLLSAQELGLQVTTLLGVGAGGLGLFNFFLVELDVVVLQVVLTEGSGVDADDAVLDESLRAHQLVVRGVVDHIENTSLAGDGLGAPREVAVVNAESAVLQVAAAGTHESDLLSAKLGVGRGSAHFELSLLLVDGHATTGRSPLVSRVPRNTHTS